MKKYGKQIRRFKRGINIFEGAYLVEKSEIQNFKRNYSLYLSLSIIYPSTNHEVKIVRVVDSSDVNYYEAWTRIEKKD